jgi:hypothetical protein
VSETMSQGDGVPRRFRVYGDMVFETIGGDADAIDALSDHFRAVAAIVRARAEGRTIGKDETINVSETSSLRVIHGGIKVDRHADGPAKN